MKPASRAADPFDTAAALPAEFEAVAAGKACWVPVYGPDPAPALAFLEAMRDYDVMHTRLTASRGPLARLRRIVAYIGSTYLSGHHW